MEDRDFLLEDEEDGIRSYTMEVLIVAMLIVMCIIFFAGRFFVIVPAGHKGVLFQTLLGGTQLNGKYYDEGFHILFPWDEMILYNTRVLEHQDTILALTKDGLEVSAEISYRYFPDYTRIGLLHKELGPDYLHSILVPHITAITRDVVSRHIVDDLYSMARDSIQVEMSRKSQYEITDNYPISIVDVVVRNIILPEKVEQAIAEKLVRKQELQEYEFRLEIAEKEAERKEIEARGIKVFTDTSQLDILKWEGIHATKELAKSPNSKVIVIGTDDGDLPIILGGSN